MKERMKMKYDRKIIVCMILIGAGLIVSILSYAGVLHGDRFVGIGSGFIGVGILFFLKQLRYIKDPQYKEEYDLALKDERCRYVRMRSWALAGYIMIIVYAVGGLVAYIFRQDFLANFLLMSVCFVLLVYSVAYFYLNKKY